MIQFAEFIFELSITIALIVLGCVVSNLENKIESLTDEIVLLKAIVCERLARQEKEG